MEIGINTDPIDEYSQLANDVPKSTKTVANHLLINQSINSSHNYCQRNLLLAQF